MAPRLSKSEYISAVRKLKKHIRRGDIYEVNFCQEFFTENVPVDPVEIFIRLNKLSPAPYGAYYRFGSKHLISSSPERFLKKKHRTLISQPMKGTIRRGNDYNEDKILFEKLCNDPKEKSENVMIVDLVRNDLSKNALKGSVKPEEMYGVYTFAQVHQMVSTISAQIRDDAHVPDIIKNTFPMGSMTGAPKVRAMELIEQYERTKRGLYSGAVGYITPEEDFDFSVVIRSILYNKKNKYLSFSVGSAITDKSDPEREYEECMVKAEAMMNAIAHITYTYRH